jgi:hypothetical protein
MHGIGDLPVELLLDIISRISRKDLRNLRLCAPRNIHPFINGVLFEEIHLPIDTSNDLERFKFEEEEAVALKRLFDISQSRIVEHVHVLVLKVTRPYNIVMAFGILLFALFRCPAY